MKTRRHAISAAVGSLMAGAGVALAQRPVENINPARHPNLAAAQDLSRQAWNKILAAQKANEWDLAGHAQKAKELLDEVNNQLKLAAEVSNANERRK